MFRENEVLTIADIKQLKKNYEAAQQIPGQMDMSQFEDQQQAAGEEQRPQRAKKTRSRRKKRKREQREQREQRKPPGSSQNMWTRSRSR